jgi:sodium-dependent dicarboxylate transporter 2/3/5
MLSVAYSASIGGMATLIGAPVNLILVGIVQESYGIEITFSRWLMIGLPKTRKQIFLTFITTFGLKSNRHSIGLVDQVLTLDDLFSE